MSLLPKPDSCKGCPAYGDGLGFVPDDLVDGAEVCIMGQNPGEWEERGRRVTARQGKDWLDAPAPHAPYIGPTGFEMEKSFFPLAGLERGKVSITNSMRCRWIVGGQRTNTMRPLSESAQQKAILHCQSAHGRIPQSTRLIVAEGEYALWALTGEGGRKGSTISGWRGWLLPHNPPPRPYLTHTDIYTPSIHDLKVLATYHLSYLNHAPWERPVSMKDWSKVPHILSGRWPKPLPTIQVEPPKVWPKKGAFDTEFYTLHTNKVLTRYSLAYRPSGLHVVEASDTTVVPVSEGAMVVMHNAEADIRYINEILGGKHVTINDTMYAHSLLWPDMAHDLDFGGSLYASINRWKHLVHTNPRVYSAGDAWGTLDWWEGMEREFERDPASLKVYQTLMLPLLPIILKATQRGHRVNRAQVKESLVEMEQAQREAQAKAEAWCGFPINLNSPPMVAKWLFDVEQIHINPISGKVRK